jgi:predicted N-acetyltransferase YhbS
MTLKRMFDILDLRERPRHVDAVAERIWKAFWRHKGAPFSQIRAGLEPFLEADSDIPFAILAEIDGKACGSALVIDHDEEARPLLTPWLAAVWVDEGVRRHGIASALLEEGVRRCGALGVRSVYLVSRPALRDFYTRLGWRVLEEGVGKSGLTLYVREPGAVPSRP